MHCRFSPRPATLSTRTSLRKLPWLLLISTRETTEVHWYYHQRFQICCEQERGYELAATRISRSRLLCAQSQIFYPKFFFSALLATSRQSYSGSDHCGLSTCATLVSNSHIYLCHKDVSVMILVFVNVKISLRQDLNAPISSTDVDIPSYS